MTEEEAQKIQFVWSNFLEFYWGKLNKIFTAAIPESLLPYPKVQIEAALKQASDHYASLGDKDTVNVIQSTLPCLFSFKEDAEALTAAGENLTNPEFVKKITDWLKS